MKIEHQVLILVLNLRTLCFTYFSQIYQVSTYEKQTNLFLVALFFFSFFFVFLFFFYATRSTFRNM